MPRHEDLALTRLAFSVTRAITPAVIPRRHCCAPNSNTYTEQQTNPSSRSRETAADRNVSNNSKTSSRKDISFPGGCSCTGFRQEDQQQNQPAVVVHLVCRTGIRHVAALMFTLTLKNVNTVSVGSCGAVGNAFGSHPRGRGFEPCPCHRSRALGKGTLHDTPHFTQFSTNEEERLLRFAAVLCRSGKLLSIDMASKISKDLEQLEEKLCDAAIRGDEKTATKLLQQGVDVNCRVSGVGNTPLHKAASGGHVDVAELLLKAGAQVDSRNKFEYTPLHYAAEEGHVGVAELLLKAGAQVDSRDRFGNTPLHNAASGGHVGVAELLLKGGTQVDRRNKDENTPLHKAASKGHVGVTKLLLKAGAQVDSRNWFGDTPLHKAASGGHVGVAELLLKGGTQVDRRNRRGVTPENIATSTDVPWYDKELDVLEGRKLILRLFEAEKLVRRYRCKVGPEGGELQTTSCTVTVPRGAVTMEAEITCQVIDPNDVTLPLDTGEMLVSDIIELGPHGTTFNKPVTVQMQYNNTSLGGNRELAVWVTKDRSQWKELKTSLHSKDKVAVSVDHFSIFAVISQPKQDQFTVSTEGFKLTSSTQPAVQVSFPEQAVTTPTEISIQVQEIPKTAVDDIKTKDESFHKLVGTSPIVNVETLSDSEVKFHKPVTVRVPHPQHYMDIQHEGPTKLRVMSCEEGAEEWMDVTDNITINRVTKEFVEFEVSHFTRWIVVVITDIYDDPEELGPIPLNLCRWLQHRAVQFILMQREDNMKQVVIECKPAEDAEREHANLILKGYDGPLPSDKVTIFEGQKVEIRLLGNVSIAPSCTQQHITFHSQKLNRLHMQVESHDGSDGTGTVAFLAMPRVKVRKEKDTKAKIRNVRKKLEKLGHSSDAEVLQPKELCALPIYVPCESARKTSKGVTGGATFKDVGKYFFFIKENVSTDWKDLAFHLGFLDPDIRNIEGKQANLDDKSRCMDMLREWQKRGGNSATKEVLTEALSNAGLQRVVDGRPQQKGAKKKLCGAAAEGDVETVTELLQQGVDVNCVNMSQFKQSPLHHAAEEGHVGVAELLLKAWAQVDSRDQDENTPLHKAALGGHVGVAELLLKAGAQVDSRDEDENTPLHIAASKGHVGVTKLLLKAGAQVDSRNGFEYTPLHYAALRGHVGVAELLLKTGAQVNSRDQDEDMPLHNTASEGHVGVAELLLKAGAQVDRYNVGARVQTYPGYDSGSSPGLPLGRTPEDIAASTDVKSWPYGKDSDRVLAGRKRILELFAAEKLARHPCWASRRVSKRARAVVSPSPAHALPALRWAPHAETL
ncbi:positive regulation of extrinsic apoptotic signaling pathway via death domain receptors protein [Branchiostoma belcheri]|nr:positive regulation of extrinsic apoptotic signaling pathway via death domain receptors protein [Branchiostoma belcheri]